LIKKIEILTARLKLIGINITLFSNYPWIYIDTINDIRVTEKFHADHGWTIAFLPLRREELQFTNTKELFKLIRKYMKKIKTDDEGYPIGDHLGG